MRSAVKFILRPRLVHNKNVFVRSSCAHKQDNSDAMS